MTLKKIDAAIRSITSNIGKLNTQIHTTALMILDHAREHGDCTRALVLVNAMPASDRRQLLVRWFNTYTPIRVVLANDKVGMLKDTAKGYTPFDRDAADANPFYGLDTGKAPGDAKMLDFDAMVKMVADMAKRIEKRIDENGVTENDKASARAIASTIKNLTFNRVTVGVNDDGADLGTDQRLMAANG